MATLVWLRDALPSEAWRLDPLRRHPGLALLQALTAVDRLIEGLRDSYRQIPELYAGLLGPDNTRALLDAHTAEAQRLTELRLQISEVERALFSAGGPGGKQGQ